jgi:cyclopropane-fatty-acyl-phospholipid synthase
MSAHPDTLAFDRAPNASDFPAPARLALRLLERLDHGSLELAFPDGQRALFGRGAPVSDLRLANWKMFPATLRGGDVGFAESFVAGDWTSGDLPRLLAFMLRNRAAAERLIYGSYWGTLLARVRHLLHRNTKAQARKNIHAHYDIGNDFYALWLDPGMTYSSALVGEVRDPHAVLSPAELAAGQDAKYARVLDELALAPGSRVLEIGCGWGGLAELAAQRGHALTGLSLSTEQLSWARERLSRRGLTAELRLQDYRDETGVYDGVASIEMFEAVGEEYWPSYFGTVARSLRPGGRACIQSIVIDEALFARYRKSTDFIQQYIFPGGMLPSPSAFTAQAEAAGLRVERSLAFGRAYARTLATWRASFLAQLPTVRALGFDERFVRIWDYYLACCEAAFAEGATDVVQYTLVRR